ncbi:MAG: DUF3253 domain-containing protein [Phenylobacterium zucineum]|nr:MAG: DUF3253 domain-containing protein [Phenylobacterium zucineum]
MMDPVESVIFDLLAKTPAGKSISPDDVAKAINAEGWRRELGKVRAVAIGLARIGKLTILRHNKPADPDTFKGVWRMRLPLEGDAPAAAEDEETEG